MTNFWKYLIVAIVIVACTFFVINTCNKPDTTYLTPDTTLTHKVEQLNETIKVLTEKDSIKQRLIDSMSSTGGMNIRYVYITKIKEVEKLSKSQMDSLYNYYLKRQREEMENENRPYLDTPSRSGLYYRDTVLHLK